MKTVMQEIGGRIRKARELAGLTQADLGRQIGVQAAAVSKYEKGDADPGTVTLAKIAEIGGVTVDWLVTGKGDLYAEPRATDPQLEAAVRESEAEWRRPGEPASEYERRILGMLRRLSPQSRQDILDTITVAYYYETEVLLDDKK